MSWDNYDEVLSQFEAAGLLPGALEAGRLVRCPVEGARAGKRDGWYILHELRTGAGAYLLVGAYGNHRAGVDANGKPISRRVEVKGRPLTPDERAAYRAMLTEARRVAEARRKRQAERAARRAAAAWDKCSPSGRSDYLDQKDSKNYGGRFSPQGNLVLPIHDVHGRLHGLQVIYSRPRNGRKKDYWPAGLAKRGHFFQIGTPTWVVLVCEGYATAASVHEATGLPTVVAFDAGNLVPVCQALKKRYRAASILVCADDDFQTEGNPGVAAASAAALATGGSWLIPAFTDRGERKLTDFNDLHQAEGLHLVRSQIEAKLTELGWRAAKKAGEQTPGLDPDEDFELDLYRLLRAYVLIYGTETAFDGIRGRVVSLSSLRAAAGKSRVREWLEHPDRRTVVPDRVVFDPTGAADESKVCNLWRGWPTQPAPGACEALLELLEYLLGAEDNPRELYNWVLRWLAYPLQNPGAKMQTAILMHGPEGTGKNTFFGAVRKIYAQYGGIFSQTELESQFNGWASGKLFMIGNEVVTRVELYHSQGRLKNMITEPEWQINEKNLPTRLEQNHCNFIFFSNRIDIAKLDREDRRYCVVWTPPALGEDFYQEVGQEIRNGGVEALHHFLLNLDLQDFSPHTKPPMTRAKRELIELGMDSTERFWRDWIEDALPIPVIPCCSEDLYSAYRHWANKEGVPKAAPAYVLLGAIGKKPDANKGRAWVFDDMGQKRYATIVWPPGADQPADVSQINWLTRSAKTFENAVADWREVR
jgi:putative DNA primase/helicase